MGESVSSPDCVPVTASGAAAGSNAKHGGIWGFRGGERAGWPGMAGFWPEGGGPTPSAA